MTSSDHLFAPGAHARLASAYAPPARAAATAAPVAPARLAMSAWERWEMDAIDPAAGGGAAQARHAGQAASVAPRAPEPPPSPALQHAAELARLRREARAAGEAEGRREGHAQGLAQGRAEGHAEGLAAGLAGASAHAEQLRALAASLPAALRRAEGELADALVALALDIARQVVHRTLQAEPAWMLTLVRDLLQAEPALQGEPRLVLHPEDAALVRQSLGGELEAAGWQVRTDEHIGRGGCRVLTASGEVDATLESRWQRVATALQRDADTDAAQD